MKKKKRKENGRKRNTNKLRRKCERSDQDNLVTDTANKNRIRTNGKETHEK